MKDYSFLLNRPEHIFRDTEIDEALVGKRVLVTGAGGSIGSAIVRRLYESPAQFIGAVGHSEAPIFNLIQSLPKTVRLEKAIADVGNMEAMNRLLDEWEPDIIFHAAAHKHVGLMEAQPREAFRNNTEVTLALASAALRSESVRKFVFISTDKAVRPTSVMGASKRLAEVGLRQFHNPFATVCRFGNVLGSAGSLVEIVEKKLAAGEQVTLTDPTMKRYFITAKEAVGLVLTAGLLEPGHCFTLDMGEPVLITDILAKMGFRTGYVVGTPGSGEKLDEELLCEDEFFVFTNTPAIKEVLTTRIVRFNEILTRVRLNPENIVKEAQLL